MTKHSTKNKSIAASTATCLVGMLLASVIAYADWDYRQQEPSYKSTLNDATVNEYFDSHVDGNEKINHLGYMTILKKMDAQLVFLENFGGENATDTATILETFDLLLPRAEAAVERVANLHVAAQVELEWLKLRMSLYKQELTQPQYKDKVTAMAHSEMKRHDEGNIFLSETSENLLFDYCNMMLEDKNAKALEEMWVRSYRGMYHSTAKNNNDVRNWFAHNWSRIKELDDYSWCELDAYSADNLFNMIMAIDTVDGNVADCRKVGDDLLYPVKRFLESCLYEQNSDSLSPRLVMSARGSDTIEMEVGSNIVKRGGVSYTLKHPVKLGFFVSEDFFDKCYPQVITTGMVEGSVPKIPPREAHVIACNTYPGTIEQLTFAMGLAAPINIENLGKLGTPSGSPSFQRDKLEAVDGSLVPVTCVPRNAKRYPQYGMDFCSAPVMSIRNNVLPSAWGIYDRGSLLSSINSLTLGGGHNDIYKSVVKFSQNPTDPALLAQYPNMSAEDIQEVVNMYSWHLERWQLPECGISAWDLSRAIQLAQWGAACGYISNEESVTLQMKIASIVQQMYPSWEAFADGYLAGYELFLGGPDTENGELGDRSYIVREIYKDGTYHGIPWDIDLTPIPPPVPVSSEAPVENAPPSSSSITTVEPEVEAGKAANDNRAVIIVVLAVVLLGVVGGSVTWVVQRKRISNDGQEPTQEK